MATEKNVRTQINVESFNECAQGNTEGQDFKFSNEQTIEEAKIGGNNRGKSSESNSRNAHTTEAFLHEDVGEDKHMDENGITNRNGNSLDHVHSDGNCENGETIRATERIGDELINEMHVGNTNEDAQENIKVQEFKNNCENQVENKNGNLKMKAENNVHATEHFLGEDVLCEASSDEHMNDNDVTNGFEDNVQRAEGDGKTGNLLRRF